MGGRIISHILGKGNEDCYFGLRRYFDFQMVWELKIMFIEDHQIYLSPNLHTSETPRNLIGCLFLPSTAVHITVYLREDRVSEEKEVS